MRVATGIHKKGGRKARLATGKALLGRALHVPLRVRASVCAGEGREIATYSRLVRPANWVGDRLVSLLPDRSRELWDTDRGACG